MEMKVALRLFNSTTKTQSFGGGLFQAWAEGWLSGSDRSLDSAIQAYHFARMCRYGSFRAQAAMHAAVMAARLVDPDYQPWTGRREEYYDFSFPSELERQFGD